MGDSKMKYWQNLSLNDLTESFGEGINYTEEWKDVIDYEGHYQISSFGRIKALKRKVEHSFSGHITMPERILKQKVRKDGYSEVNLAKNGIHTMKAIAILVGTHFVINEHNKKEINHKKGIKLDNRFHQLEWVTPQENIIHSFKILNRKSSDKNGSKNPNYNNFKVYLHKEMGVYFSAAELSNMIGIKVPTLRGLFTYYKNDNRISNYIKV